MTARLCFDVPGIPVPKARARVMAAGYSFTPERTRAYEKHVRAYAMQAVSRLASWPKDAEYRVQIAVWRARRQGDCDNFAKAVTDPLNSIVWNDDVQVAELHVMRFDDKANPHVQVTIEVLTPSTPPAADEVLW